jgi:hypothetical protein
MSVRLKFFVSYTKQEAKQKYAVCSDTYGIGIKDRDRNQKVCIEIKKCLSENQKQDSGGIFGLNMKQSLI